MGPSGGLRGCEHMVPKPLGMPKLMPSHVGSREPGFVPRKSGKDSEDLSHPQPSSAKPREIGKFLIRPGRSEDITQTVLGVAFLRPGD